MFWQKKKKENEDIKSEEFEALSKKIVAIVGDIDTLSHRVEGIDNVVRSNRARITKIKVDEIIDEKSIKPDGIVYLGEGRLKP